MIDGHYQYHHFFYFISYAFFSCFLSFFLVWGGAEGMIKNLPSVFSIIWKLFCLKSEDDVDNFSFGFRRPFNPGFWAAFLRIPSPTPQGIPGDSQSPFLTNDYNQVPSPRTTRQKGYPARTGLLVPAVLKFLDSL